MAKLSQPQFIKIYNSILADFPNFYEEQLHFLAPELAESIIKHDAKFLIKTGRGKEECVAWSFWRYFKKQDNTEFFLSKPNAKLFKHLANFYISTPHFFEIEKSFFATPEEHDQFIVVLERISPDFRAKVIDGQKE